MHNDHWYKAAMYEKIAEARRVAAHDRLVLTADNARREAQQAAGSPFARLVWMLATYSGGAVRRWRERSRPVEQQISTLTSQVWELIGRAVASGSVRNIERDLLALARRREALNRRKMREASRLESPPPDDPAWRDLDEMFGSARRRREFVSLLEKMRRGEGSHESGDE
jgi:hypothetical protein